MNNLIDIDLDRLKDEMRQAARNRKLSAWAKRAQVDRSWCDKFIRGEIASPRVSQVRKMLEHREHAA